MRYTRTRKAETRSLMIETAARALRRDGVDGIGLIGLMGEAGLTKGGFYAHFGSKDDLVAEAVATSLQGSADRMQATRAAALAEGLSPLAAIINAYLSAAHATTPEIGCTIGALLSDLSRSKDPVRSAAAGGASQLVTAIEQALPEAFGSGRKARAKVILGTLAGCLQLARLEQDAVARDALLASAREAAMLLAEATSTAVEVSEA